MEYDSTLRFFKGWWGMDGTLHILRNPNGKRYTLYLYLLGGGTWLWGVGWQGNNRNVNNPSAVLATLLLGRDPRR